MLKSQERESTHKETVARQLLLRPVLAHHEMNSVADTTEAVASLFRCENAACRVFGVQGEGKGFLGMPLSDPRL